ncbi:hypothetical protein GF1_16560 [Desulfolithobacter dissulfuricans]|uniref:PilZ domain-containing protein n=1 Tax=Desulfolithobacter dissulfuricans TaxID=2795293 RepID=A0A915XIK9_9BACT|nr:PilZ domain-containing protein [Desulfolithobacter dissulfuricans]BCO09280.1 hypothetical protein GF1_16560 [Desulfolithobacter dissulfuricans]
MNEHIIACKDRRKFSRINLCSTAVIYCDDGRYKLVLTKNLILGGIYVLGEFNITIGEICTIEIFARDKNIIITMMVTAEVVRKDDNGLALNFLEMEQGTYSQLQEIILDKEQDDEEF